MSYARAKRLQYDNSLQGKRPVRPKKAAAQKKEWVSTVNDLTVHKSTPEELSRRHEVHKSHNRVVAQWELKERALRRRRGNEQPTTPPALDKYRLNLIREVFSDQYTLQDVLARSDRAMAVVKDLFGDAPHRQAGTPKVTVAPGGSSDPQLPVLQKPDPPTQLSILSQSMLDPQALNEPEEHSEEEADCSILSPKDSERCGGPSQRSKTNTERLEQRSPPQTPCNTQAPPAQTALNATVAVERMRSRQGQPQPRPASATSLVSQVLNPSSTPPRSARKRSSRPARGRCAASASASASGLAGSSCLSASLNGSHSSLAMLQSMLGQVESQLDLLGPLEPPTADDSGTDLGSAKGSGQSLTGFSVALVSTISRLTRLLTRREEEAQRECEARRRLEEVVREQRVLIDALSAETLTLRDESAALQAGLQQRMYELEERVDTVVLALGDLGPLGDEEGHTGPLEDHDEDTPEPELQYPVKLCSEPQAVYPGVGPTSQPQAQAQAQTVYPAVLLSPPHQRDSPGPPTSRGGGASRSLAQQYEFSGDTGGAAPHHHSLNANTGLSGSMPQYGLNPNTGTAHATASQYGLNPNTGTAHATASPQYGLNPNTGTAHATASQYTFPSAAERVPFSSASAPPAHAVAPPLSSSVARPPLPIGQPQQSYEASSSVAGSERSSPCSFASLPGLASLLDPSLGLPLHLQQALHLQISQLARHNAQMLTRHNAHGLTQQNTQPLTQQNSHGLTKQNTHAWAQQNTHGQIQQNTQALAQQNTHGQIQQNTHGQIQQNTHGQIQQNNHGQIQQNNQGLIQRHTQAQAQQNSHVLIQQNSQAPVQHQNPQVVLSRQGSPALAHLDQRRVSPAGSYTSRELQASGRSSPASLVGQATAGAAAAAAARAPPSGQQTQAQQSEPTAYQTAPTISGPVAAWEPAVIPTPTTNMEERLLQLSRQSAAARSKLLELIEQQRLNNSSVQASPCVSPVTAGPNTGVPRRTPDMALVEPERDACSQSSGGSRRSAGISPTNLSRPDNHRTQVERQRGDGWFALSTHVQ
ncbi:spindle and centriole-associated protein 1 [Engraulis encrasicolus]|uniref:spindle and centriole-associated protein 1 n=1 Tax=Engraulis encrasicolus TaxID=184585 RepID=UPI002FD472EE